MPTTSTTPIHPCRRLIVVLGDQLDADSTVFQDFDPELDWIWMAEVAGEGAFLIHDASPDAIAARLEEVLADRDELARRGEAARARAAELSWTATARKTADVWREALGMTG